MDATTRSIGRLAVAAALSAIAAVSPATAASYADLATLSLAAPVVVRATVIKADRIASRLAPGLAAGDARLLVTAATHAALVAPAGVPPKLTFLVDVALDARGRPPKLAGADELLFVRPGTAADEVVLVAAQGAVPWTAATEATVRDILTTARRADAPPVVTGVTSAFRVPGAVPGEAESQFFLSTAGGKPVSLVVLTRPDEGRRLTIATGDVIDDAARDVPKDSLLWFRLACGLPAALPASLAAGPELTDDWRFVHASLGACGRTF